MPRAAEEGTEVVLLTDYSEVTYHDAEDGFCLPPGLQHGAEAPPKRRWAGRRTPWRPAMTAELVRELEERRASVARMISREPVEVSFPAPGDPDQAGFRIPEPDAMYLVAEGDAKGRPRTLDFALPGRAPAGDQVADDLDRLELTRLLAITVDALHRADVVTAGLGWSDVLFTLAPRPSVVLQRPEGIRRVGGEFLDPTRDTNRHEDASASPFDADRYQLALLAYRLLVSHEPEGDIDPWRTEGLPGLSGTQVKWSWGLWERSAGPAGSRPQASEWIEALGA